MKSKSLMNIGMICVVVRRSPPIDVAGVRTNSKQAGFDGVEIDVQPRSRLRRTGQPGSTLGLPAGTAVTIRNEDDNPISCDLRILARGVELNRKTPSIAAAARESNARSGPYHRRSVCSVANGPTQDRVKLGVEKHCGDGGTCRIRGRATRCRSI